MFEKIIVFHANKSHFIDIGACAALAQLARLNERNCKA
jgi:hypothetical protein